MTQGTQASTAARYGARSSSRMWPRTYGRSSVETGSVPRPGKCFAHAPAPAAASPRANATPKNGERYWRAPSGPSGRSSTGARSTCTPAARSERPVSRPAANAYSFVRIRRADLVGGRARNARTSPPSWSANTSDPGGRRALRSQRCTRTPPTPLGAGSPDTTRSAAFCCGDSAITAALVITAARPKAPVD